MDKETKIVEIISKLGVMIGDWEDIDDEDIQAEAENLIIKAARKLIAVVDEKNSEKKSEMPCNCKQEKTLPENIDKIIEKAIEEAAGELTDSKTFAAIVFRID